MDLRAGTVDRLKSGGDTINESKKSASGLIFAHPIRHICQSCIDHFLCRLWPRLREIFRIIAGHFIRYNRWIDVMRTFSWESHNGRTEGTERGGKKPQETQEAHKDSAL